MCGVNEYDRDHPSGNDYASSGVGWSFPIESYKEALESLINTFNFIDKWLQCLEAIMTKE